MGSYFISYETVIGMCTDINKQLYADGLFTGQREIDLEIMAKNRLELICTPEEIATLTPEEYASYLVVRTQVLLLIIL